MEDDRETCCKNGCDRSAAIVLKVYITDHEPVFLPFCVDHLLDGSGVIESIIADMIGVNDADNEE